MRKTILTMKNTTNNVYSSLSPKKIIILLAALLVLVIIMFSCFSPKKKGAEVAPNPDVFTEATVTKIVDGDTFWVEWEGGSDKVRLIGINAPEVDQFAIGKSNGDYSTDYINSIIKVDQVVYMQTDVSDDDQYNRLLRYVWLEKPEDKENDETIRSKMLNALILLNGYAQAVEYTPDVKYSEIFSEYQAEAQKNKVGLWQEDTTE